MQTRHYFKVRHMRDKECAFYVRQHAQGRSFLWRRLSTRGPARLGADG